MTEPFPFVARCAVCGSICDAGRHLFYEGMGQASHPKSEQQRSWTYYAALYHRRAFGPDPSDRVHPIVNFCGPRCACASLSEVRARGELPDKVPVGDVVPPPP